MRLGTLKGKGPGKEDGAELGLSRTYYDSLLELEDALVTQAYEKFTLGTAVAVGDPFDGSNPLLRTAYKGSFDARHDETSRVVAGGAIVAALRHPRPVELSVGSARAEAPPTLAEWEALFRQL